MQTFIRSLTKNPVQKIMSQPIRGFNRSIKPPQVNNTGSYMMMAAALGGMGYLAYSSMDLKRN